MTMQAEDIKKLLKKNPKDFSARKMLGSCYLNSGNFREAVKEYQIAAAFYPRIASDVVVDFEKYLQNDPENVPAMLGLVDFYLFQGDLESAIMELEELVDIAPEAAYIYNLLGRIYLKLGRIDGAISLLEKAMDAGKGDPSLLEALASAYVERERYSDAILLYEELLKSDQNSKAVLRTLTELYKRVNNPDGAAEKCVQMLKSDPEVLAETVEKLESLVAQSPQSYCARERLAEVYSNSLKPDAAMDQLGEVLKINPARTDNAVRILRNMLQTYQENQEVLIMLAECLIKKTLYSEAVELYNRALKLNPGLIDSCISGYTEIIKAYPDQALARRALADSYLSKGLIEEALLEFRHVVRLNPGEIEDVEKKCREILKQNPKMSVALLVLAESFLAGGELRKAISLAEEFLQKENDNKEAYVILGDAYTKLNILPRAVESYRTALKLSPYDTGTQNKYRQASEKEIDSEIYVVRGKIEQDSWRVGLHLDLAKLLFKKGVLDGAIRSLQNAVKDVSRAPYSHNLMGQIFKEQCRFDLAAAQFEKALEIKNLEDHELIKNCRANLGSCLEAQGRVSEAISAYEAVISSDIDFGSLKQRIKHLNATNPASIRNRSLVMVFKTPECDELGALWGQDIKKSRTSDDEDLTLVSFGQDQNTKGFDEYMKGKESSAEENFMLAAQLDMYFCPSQNNLSVLSAQKGDIAQAQTRISEAVSGENTAPPYRNNMGVIHLLKKDYLNAEKEFKAALRLDKDFSTANICIGDIELLKGNVEQAMGYYGKVDQFDPLYELSARRTQYWKV